MRNIISSKSGKTTTLVVLAGGLGTRYGSVKQLDAITPSGETLLDFSLFDAIGAGFEKIVFVVRRAILEDFKRAFDQKLSGCANVSYACQDDGDPKREKPWGTAHAVLAARECVNERFCVINADDFYGRDAFKKMLRHEVLSTSDFLMTGFLLKNTLSDYGTVSRGECFVDNRGFLEAVIERTGILSENGKIHSDGDRVEKLLLNPDTIVSMNFWGFTPAVFEHLDAGFSVFLDEHRYDSGKEFYITDVVNTAVAKKQVSVSVLKSKDKWMGITYRDDKTEVIKRIGDLRRQGVYPAELW